MSQDQIREILTKYKVVAIVGVSQDPSKDGYRVAEYLKGHGFHIIPINPFADQILGEKCHKSLPDIPSELQKKLEIVDIFRPSKEVPSIVNQIIQLKESYGAPYVVWMQLGITNEQAAEIAKEAGLKVVMNKCMMQEHRRLSVSDTGFMQINAEVNSMVVVTKAVDRDLPDVLSLLKEVDLPVEGVADHFHHFFVARQGECVVGCAGVEIYENSGLLRSVAVHPSFQDQGLGRELVEKIEDFANEEHLKEIYLLTDTAEQFFSNLNYKIISREDVNPKVNQSSEFTSVCDISAVCMKKVLK